MSDSNGKCLSSESKRWCSSSCIDYRPNDGNDYRYSSHPNGRPLIDQAIQDIRSQSNDLVYKNDFRYQSKSDSKLVSKRPIICYEDRQPKRPRVSDVFDSPDTRVPDFRHNSSNETNSRDIQLDLYCKSCHSSSHSMKDFSQHLRGKRHQIKAVQQSKPLKISHKLQQMLNNTKEAIIGLDFMKEVHNNLFPQETSFNCLLCKCYQMPVNNAFQHIIGFRHQNNFLAFIHPNNKELLTDNENRQTDNRLVRSLAQKYERLYGRGNCQYIDINSNDSTDCFPSRQVNIEIKSNARDAHKLSSNVKKVGSDDKMVEAFKSIRNICDQMIAYYSPKSEISVQYSPNDENQKNALNCWSQMKNICADNSVKIEKL